MQVCRKSHLAQDSNSEQTAPRVRRQLVHPVPDERRRHHDQGGGGQEHLLRRRRRPCSIGYMASQVTSFASTSSDQSPLLASHWNWQVIGPHSAALTPGLPDLQA